MNVQSLQGRLRQKYLSSAARRVARRRPRLHVQSLEAREVPATVPTVLSVTPATGQELTTSIVVDFSENVTGAATVANYRLFAQDGRAFPFTVTYDAGTTNATITPTGALPAGTYSLFIQGDQIQDTDGDNLRLAQAGQLVVANNNGAAAGNVTPTALGTTGLGGGTAISTTPGNPRQAVAGDLNGDGILDLAVPVPANNQVQIYFGLAAGGYNTTPTRLLLATGTGPLAVALGDVDGDGDRDVVTANGIGNSVAVFRNNGTGTFAAPQLSPVGPTPTDLVLADFNGDGALDVAVSHNGNRPIDRGVTVRLNNGVGGFNAPTEFLSKVRAGSLAAADFDRDGFVDLAVAENFAIGTVRILRGIGDGSFSERGTLSVGALPADIAVGDFNADGFADIATVSGSAASTKDLTVLLNSAGAGFRAPLHTEIPNLQSPIGKAPLQSLAVVYGNQDPYPDLVVTSQAPFPLFPPAAPKNNVLALTGLGDGSFVPYLGEYNRRGGATAAQPSYVSVVSDPFRLLSAFDVDSATVRVNLVRNGNFEARSLDGSQGSLDGWSVFKLRDATTGSRGAWAVQSGDESPLSSIPLGGNPPAFPVGPTPWPNVAPTGPQGFQAMLDQQRLIPIIPGNPDPNPASNYEGSHALYQDIFIPAGTTAKLSLRLALLSNAPWSNTGDNTTLDYRTGLPNQQVRVDVMRITPGGAVLDVGADVLLNVFTTSPSDLTSETRTFTDIDLSAFAGQTIRLRVASANNQGHLLVGVDNVRVEALGTDSTAPVLDTPTFRNPSFVPGPGGIPQSTDPTIVGRVGDTASVNNITKLVFDLANNGFGGPDDQAVTTFDVNGNYSFLAQELLPGLRQVPVRVVDQAGLTSETIFSFVIQGPSQAVWQSAGPGATDVSNQGVDYETVAGKLSGIALDPRDPTGNTFYISAPNGGVWRTTNGGNDWKALTDNVVDPSGQRVNVPVGALGIGSDGVVYAATGVDDASPTSRAGVGVLRSADNGQTWTVTGPNVFAGARVSKLGVDPTNSNIVYVAVTSWVDPSLAPGLFKTTNGGATWVNVLDPANMIDPRTNSPLGAGAAIASVTDLLVDPFNPGRLIVGLGNIGQAPSAASAGVWKSADGGSTWFKALGGDKTYLTTPSTIPDGTAIGRVTLAQGAGRVGDERVVYVMLSQPPAAPNPHPFDDENFGHELLGIYKSKDNLLNYTKVMLREYVPDGQGRTRFLDIDVLGHEGHTVGALVVDPANPNVFYVGGAARVGYGGDPPVHSTIRVDTGNMRDADYFDFARGNYPNDGDDIDKYGFGWNPATNSFRNYLNVQSDLAYVGEGVYWYDLELGVINSSFSFNRFLPAASHRVVTDPQGRLLFGTAGGLFRGTPLGFDYDFTSGGAGILALIQIGNNVVPFLPTPNPRGMDFTDLNGNLQINDLTGAGINPADPKHIVTAQVEVGTGVTLSGVNAWTSSGIAGAAANIPNAVTLLVASPTPGAPPGTPPVMYRLWQENEYLNELTRVPEISTDGGVTFRPAGLSDNAGLSLNDASPVHPAMAINPTKFFNSTENQYYDELLYGVDRVYLTRTSGNVWDAISGRLSANGFVSALALAPSANGVYYAGTTDGLFFARAGAGGFVDRSVGLPGIRINGITVDPTDHNTVYLTLNVPVGGGASVYKTIDGGLTWTALGTTGLPSVPAYTLAIDPPANAGGTDGRLYVGTDRGAYISLDGGATWALAATGLPAVPVVGLQISQALETLVATTQGRGVFTLSTNRIGASVTSARKTNQAGSLPDTNSADDPKVNERFNQFDITFSEPIDATSFAASDIVVKGPDGNVISNATLNLQVVNVTDQASAANGDIWRVTFDGSQLVVEGAYQFIIGPNILDENGNQMNQNGVLPNGEPSDAFNATFSIAENDLADFVTDTFDRILNRAPTAAEFTSRNVTAMATARLNALGVVVKELLATFNSSEARKRMIERFLNNGNAAGEIGHLLPTYTLSANELGFFVSALKNGTRSPQSIIVDLIATTDATKGYHDEYFAAAGGTATGFLNKLYADLYKGTGIQFSWLPSGTQNTQITQASTPAGRLTLTRTLVNGGLVRYHPGGNTANPLVTTDFRSHLVQLTYQKYLGRAATPTEVSAGKTLLARPLAINSIQGYEWLLWKVMASQEYFNLQVQDEPGTPLTNPEAADDGMHTNRSWVQSVIEDRMYRASLDGERDSVSRKVLDRFKLQRQTFVHSIVLSSVGVGIEYRDQEINKYFLLAHNRTPTDVERAAEQTKLRNGATFQGLYSARFATAEFYSINAPEFVGAAPSNNTWARGVYLQLLGQNLAPNDPKVINLASKGGTVATRQAAVLALLNGKEYRARLIGDVFQMLLGRAPSATELTAYQNFLTTRRWEHLFSDILANGAAIIPGTPVNRVAAGLPQAFWETI